MGLLIQGLDADRYLKFINYKREERRGYEEITYTSLYSYRGYNYM